MTSAEAAHKRLLPSARGAKIVEAAAAAPKIGHAQPKIAGSGTIARAMAGT